MSDIRSFDVISSGAPLEDTHVAAILLHGRGATAEDMLSLADAIGRPDIAYTAPQAPGRTWYPYSFLAPIAQNEPALSRSLGIVHELVGRLMAEGMSAERIVLMG